MNEYIRLSKEECLYSKRNLLSTEAACLITIKRLKEYKKLRDEEFVLKIAAKKKLNEVIEEMLILEKFLPRAHVPKQSSEENEIKDSEKFSLEHELEEIRQKIAHLK